MKNFKFIFLFILLALGFSAFAQNDKVAQQLNHVLSEMPAADAALRDQLVEQLLGLEGEGLSMLIGKLTPPGEGNDTPARYALEGMAIYLSQPGEAARRKAFSAGLTAALKGNLHDEIKAFLIRRLQFTAQTSDVAALKVFIGDAYLSAPSLRALLNIGGPEVERALAQAIDGVTGPQRIGIVKALGEMGSPAANEKIISQLNSSDPDLKSAVWYTLARSADPKAYATLASAAAAAGYRYTPGGATQSFLDYGANLRETGQLKLSKKVARTVLKNTTTNDQLAAKTEALTLLVQLRPERADKLLKGAVQHPNKAYRNTALGLVNTFPDSEKTLAWAKDIGEYPDPVKVDIIQMLEQRGDKSALPYLKPLLQAEDLDVKVAALKAVVKLDPDRGIDTILDFMRWNGRLAAAGKTALLPLTGQEELKKLVAELPNQPGDAQAALIEIIALRKGKDHFNQIYSYVSSENAMVREAALNALEALATASNIDQLTGLLPALKSPEEQQAGAAALLSALQDIQQASERSKKALELLKNPAYKEAVLLGSPALGGKELLQSVIGEYRDGSHRESAFTALAAWQGSGAASELYQIVIDPSASQFRDRAFQGYLKAATSELLPEDQRLLMLRKAMSVAKNTQEQKAILQRVAGTRTFLAFQFALQFLDDPQLKQPAAGAAMNIALPKPDESHGLYGDLVTAGLEKVMQAMDGPESQYAKVDIQNYLDHMPEGTGFVPMFNGEDLTGWEGFVANPYQKSAMTSDELSQKQAEANRAMSDTWGVKDGAIVFNGKGHNLVSTKDYGDFEMIVDWRITKDGDSGIYLRGTPQIQIWDTARVDVGAQVGSGGLYNNQKSERNPLVLADNAIGDWNTFRITMVGEKVTVFLNGQLVVDEVPLENYWDRSQAIFPAGPIELQAHGTDLAFRDIYIREIASPDFSLRPEEKRDGFASLFNGKDLNGWVGNKTAYQAKDGLIVVDPKGGGGGNLFTEKEYSDFILRFEFQLTPGANNGLGIHAPLEGDAAYVGKELQILDNTAPIYADLKPYQYHGSVYGIIPAKRGYLNPVGAWNREEVIVRGSQVKVILNGTTIVDGDFLEASKNGTMDGRDHPGLKRTKGHIGFLGHGSALKFRNIRIKDLAE